MNKVYVYSLKEGMRNEHYRPLHNTSSAARNPSGHFGFSHYERLGRNTKRRDVFILFQQSYCKFIA